MIIWINGAFGSGKTQTAFELKRRIPGSYVYDPENAGYFIRSNIPDAAKCGDFQNYPMWRDFNYKMLKYTTTKFNGVIIAPMTVTDKSYFDQIVGRLREDGIDVKHFILYASKAELIRRLKTRGDGHRSWAAKQIDRCIEAFDSIITEGIVDTEKISVSQAAEEIARKCGITLISEKRGVISGLLYRAAVKIRHIRWLPFKNY